jgi:ubiquinol-cytochrome c reductase cytochrome c1 subunit
MGSARRIVLLLAVLLAAGSASGAEGPLLEHAGNDPGDLHSLQRGARNFMNYCAGCHSAKYVRFNTIADDLELTEELMIENLMFNAEKTYETIQSNMTVEDSARWFGSPPPDLSLMARARTTDYIYSFLKGFYVDPDSPTGVDNRVLRGTSMPHVLWDLQGFQRGVFGEDEHGSFVFQGFEPLTAGSMSAEEFDSFVRDTVNFLEFISEPVRSKRRALGVWVLGFLAIFLVFAALLKKQVWKDVR